MLNIQRVRTVALYCATCAGLVSAGAVARPLSSPSQFRFWIDYQAFSSPESAALPEAALVALGGVKAGMVHLFQLNTWACVLTTTRDRGAAEISVWATMQGNHAGGQP